MKPDLVAPGNRIVAYQAPSSTFVAANPANVPARNYYTNTTNTSPSAYYVQMSGTSMAAPMVAGAAALGPLALLSPALGSGGDDAATACAKAVALAEGRPVPQSAKPATGSQPQQQSQPSNPVDNLKRGLGNLLGR